MPVTVHKAIDLSSDPESDIHALKGIAGVDSVLTSGGATMAIDGVAKIMAIQKLAEGNINIIAAGRITAENVEELHRELGLRAYHGRRIV